MCFYMVEDKGIEPLTEACKATVFPLAPIPRDWSEYKDSNLGPLAPKASALPGCATLRIKLAPHRGFEPRFTD